MVPEAEDVDIGETVPKRPPAVKRPPAAKGTPAAKSSARAAPAVRLLEAPLQNRLLAVQARGTSSPSSFEYKGTSYQNSYQPSQKLDIGWPPSPPRRTHLCRTTQRDPTDRLHLHEEPATKTGVRPGRG